MATRAASLVQQYIDKECPTLISALGGKPRFVVVTNDFSEFKTERLFLASPHSSWSSHPSYDSVAEAYKPASREGFELLVDTRPETISLSKGNVVIGPSSATLRQNNAVSGGSFLERIVTAEAKGFYPPNGRVVGVEYIGKTVEQVEAMPVFRDFKIAMGKLGVNFGPVVRLQFDGYSAVPFEYLQTLFYSVYGPGKVFAYQTSWETAPDQSPATVFFTYAERPDDSVGLIKLQEFFWELGDYPRYSCYGPITATYPTGGPPVTVPDHGAPARTIQAQLLTNFGTPPGASTLDNVSELDYNWLPLIGIERNQEHFTVSPIADTVITSESFSTHDVVSVVLTKGASLGAVPVNWYIDYANREIAKGAANKSDLEKAVASLQDYRSQVITYVEYSDAIMLPQNIVELTTVYRDYGKAKEKACEENDFLKKEFSEGWTYGAVQTKINGSRNTRVFYGYRDSDLPVQLALPVSTTERLTLTLGGEIVTSRQANGQFGPSFTKDQAGEFVEAVQSDATLIGGTMESQLALWGLSVNDVAGVVAGLKEMRSRISNSTDGHAYGTSQALYDFRWGSLGISGYPLYNEVDPQTGYRIAMISKTVLSQVGPMFRTVHQGRILKSRSLTKYPTL